MISTCEICGAELRTPVAAILHYERNGYRSECDRRVERLGRLEPDVVVSLGRGKDRRHRRKVAAS